MDGNEHDRERGEDLAKISAFERELAELKPRDLDAGLTARLEGALGTVAEERLSEVETGARSKIVRFLAPVAAAAAVVVLAVVMLPGESGEKTAASAASGADGLSRLEPVAAENYLLDARDGDIVLVDGKTPYREVYLDYEDSYHWRDAELETDVRYYQARTEVVYVPVTVY